MKTIPLTQGKIALVDDEDFERLCKYRWYSYPRSDRATFYATRANKRSGKTVYMHREILRVRGRKTVDHIDGNGLDNRRANLRACSHQQNCMNQKMQSRSKSSRFKGVYRMRTRRKWRAQVRIDGKAYALGHFPVEEDAAIAYNVAAQLFFGEFARLNPV